MKFILKKINGFVINLCDFRSDQCCISLLSCVFLIHENEDLPSLLVVTGKY